MPATENYDFIELSRPSHLTIADVEKLSPGDELDVVIWDGNFEEYWIWDKSEPNRHYDPEEFYRANHHRLVYLGNLTWTLYIDGEIVDHPIHLNTEDLLTTRSWVAVEGGEINIRDEYLPRDWKEIPSHWKPIKKRWEEFPKTTRAGWRGPIMLWKDLSKYGQVFYDPKAIGKMEEICKERLELKAKSS